MVSWPRAHGASKKGTEHFIAQRVTALANIPLTIFLVITIAIYADADHQSVAAFLGHPFYGTVMLLLILNTTWHMRVGLQVVIEDYIHHEPTKLASVVSNNFFATSVGLACVVAELRLIFNY